MSALSSELKTVKVRKEHNCCCYDIILDSGCGEEDFTKDEWDSIQAMKAKNGKILPGEECLYWSGKFDGEMFAAYADKDLYEIVIDKEWFDY